EAASESGFDGRGGAGCRRRAAPFGHSKIYPRDERLSYAPGRKDVPQGYSGYGGARGFGAGSAVSRTRLVARSSNPEGGLARVVQNGGGRSRYLNMRESFITL